MSPVQYCFLFLVFAFDLGKGELFWTACAFFILAQALNFPFQVSYPLLSLCL